MNMAEMTMREKLRSFMEETGRNIKETAEEAGISRPTLSLYLNGEYNGNTQNVEKKLETYLDRKYGFHTGGGTAGVVRNRVGLFQTMDASGIVNTCEACQSFHGIGVITGASGYGKTYTLRYYARKKKVLYVECIAAMGRRDLLEALREQIGLHGVRGSVYKQVRAICDLFAEDKGWLIIVDEADKLLTRASVEKMEILRGIYDQSDEGVGLVLAGEPELEGRIKGLLPRLESRTGIHTELAGLTPEEVEEYLEGYDVDADALDLLKRRATNRKNGCFRMLDRTINNLVRLMNERGETRISAELMEEVAKISFF